MTSVVVPAFNAERSLPKCLSALRHQTRPPDEIVVVDDGSTDGTADVARSFGASLVQQSNQGPAVARNAGARQIRGDILLFTDADCEPESDWVEEMVRPFSDPEVAGVKGTYRTRQRERIARLAQCEFEERYDRLARFPKIDFVDTYSAAFRLAAFRAVSGFDSAFPEANNEDVDLSYRLARAGHKLVFNRRAVVYHQHQASWRSYFRLKMRRGYWRMIVYRLHPGKAIHDTYTPQNLKLQVILLPLAVLLAIIGCVAPRFWYGSAGCLGLLCLTGLSYARTTWARDPQLLPWVFPFLLTRAAAFVVGVVAGVLGAIARPGQKTKAHEPGPLYRTSKRAFDIGGSLLGLLFTALVYVPIAVAITLDSPGPVIFGSDRAGRRERLFRVYKFRTMQVTTLPSGYKPTENDERVTRVGRFLRRTSLDELPQCYNVLRGEMSIVGPRPEQVAFMDAYQGHQRRRFDVTPGLTGWWQVNGRKQPMYDHAEEDVYYVEHQSFWLDLIILVRTVGAVIGGRGAV